MPEDYTTEQLGKLYKDLPNELKEVIFSLETADSIYDICARNEIEKVKELAKYVGHVLLGVLPPDEFQETIKKELKLKEDKAKKVAQEINRFIFYPVKPVLEEIYKIEIKPSVKLAEKPKREKIAEEKPSIPPRKDIYREPTE